MFYECIDKRWSYDTKIMECIIEIENHIMNITNMTNIFNNAPDLERDG